MVKKINFFGLKEEYSFLKKKIRPKVEKVFFSGKYLQGSEIKNLENNLSKYFSNKSVITVNSCTDALFFALKALNLKQNSEVLVTSFSFIASMSSILRAGLKPVFVDIDDNYNLDLSDAKKKISGKTKALIFVHLFGKSGNLKKLQDFCKQYKIELIEDIAQALGSIYRNKKCGTIGRFGCISFDPTKTIAAPGSGGAIICNRKSDYNKIQMLRYHGKNKNDFKVLGFNSQMSELTATILNEKLKYNNLWIKKRNKIAKTYNLYLSKKIIKPKINNSEVHIFHKYVIRVKKRDLLVKYLQKNKIPCLIHYKKPLYGYRNLINHKIININCDKISKEVISLPIHPFLKEPQVKYICNKVNNFIENLK